MAAVLLQISQRMRIGIEAQRIFRKKKHGMDIVALELIRHLQQLDKTNEYVVFAKEDEDDGVIAETGNFRIVRIPGRPYPYWEQVLLPREVRRQNIELLHCTANTAPVQLDVPLIVTLHDIIYLEKWNFTEGTTYQILGNLYRRFNVPAVVRKASRILTVSDFENKRIKAHFGIGADKVNTVYNGVSSHFRRVADRSRLEEVRRKYSLPTAFAFFLGNTDPKKNVAGVLRALGILKKQDALNFMLVMPDIDRDYLHRLMRSIGEPTGLLDNICFTGYIPNGELPAIYSLADFFLYPSLRESFGIPMLEAMACGTPVITSSSSSMPEVAGDAALFVDPADPGAIAAGISKLRSDAILREDLISKGLRRSARFSWEKNAQQTLHIYTSVLNSEKYPA
jgi:glycosyltransferase involved in cell wall biosynthesis